MIALILEVWNDKEGDLNKGADVFIRLLFLWIESWALHFIFHKPAFDSFLLSTAIFFMIFDYAIAYVLIKNGTLEPPLGVKYNWFTYTAKAGVFDNLKTWRNISPWIKFSVKLVVLITAIVIWII